MYSKIKINGQVNLKWDDDEIHEVECFCDFSILRYSYEHVQSVFGYHNNNVLKMRCAYTNFLAAIIQSVSVRGGYDVSFST